MSSTIILGSGMAAWGAFDRLTANGITPRVFDKNSFPGGHTASFETNGFVFDDGPHISFTEIERIQDHLADAVDQEYEILNARVDNWYRGTWVKHPAIAYLHGLPTDLVSDCLSDFIEAVHSPDPETFANYHEWLVAAYGPTFANTFPTAYGTKYHTVGPELMNTSWLGPRLYRPELKQVIDGALGPVEKELHYIDKFRYPKQRGFVHYLNKFVDASDLALNHEATAIDPAARTITFSNGHVEAYEELISSVPLPEIVKLLPNVPTKVSDAAKLLACTSCVTVNFGVARSDLSPCHWRYIYDLDMMSVRVSFPHMFSPTTVPDGCGAVQVEVYYSDKYRPLDHPVEDDIAPVKAELIQMGILREDDEILVEEARFAKYANVIFDLDSDESAKIVQDYLSELDISYCGRYGDWAYIWTDESYMSGESAAQNVVDRAEAG